MQLCLRICASRCADTAPKTKLDGRVGRRRHWEDRYRSEAKEEILVAPRRVTAWGRPFVLALLRANGVPPNLADARRGNLRACVCTRRS
jgi:hypothetical protein